MFHPQIHYRVIFSRKCNTNCCAVQPWIEVSGVCRSLCQLLKDKVKVTDILSPIHRRATVKDKQPIALTTFYPALWMAMAHVNSSALCQLKLLSWCCAVCFCIGSSAAKERWIGIRADDKSLNRSRHDWFFSLVKWRLHLCWTHINKFISIFQSPSNRSITPPFEKTCAERSCKCVKRPLEGSIITLVKSKYKELK